MKPLLFTAGLTSLITLLIGGCVTAEYAPPQKTGLSDLQTSRVYDVGIDTVWEKIDTFSNGFFFQIYNIERDLGIISAKFKGDPGTYVDGGSIKLSRSGNSEAYTVYMRKKNLQLSGDLTLTLTQVGKDKTRILVNAQYNVILPGRTYENPFNGQVVNEAPKTWSFDSKGFDSKVLATATDGTSDKSRTFTASGALEAAVLEDLAEYLM